MCATEGTEGMEDSNSNSLYGARQFCSYFHQGTSFVNFPEFLKDLVKETRMISEIFQFSVGDSS